MYSHRFFAGKGVASQIDEHVPAGVLWIVRDVDVYCNAPLGGARFTFMGELGQAIWTAVWAPNTTSAQQWRGRQVFETGTLFSVKADEPTDVTVSGYVLTLP